MRLLPTIVLILPLSTALAALPLSFERRSPVLYQARAGTETLIIEPGSVTARGVTLRFAGSSASARLEGVGHSSPATYLYGNSSTTYTQFSKLALRRVYPGIDVVFYGNSDHLEYDFVVAPGADLQHIRLAFDGARKVQVNAAGDLKIEEGSGYFMQMLPRVFQSDGHRIAADYVLLPNRQVGFRVGRHNPRLALTIDPELVFTKYFGGSGSDSASAIATDAQGNLYIAGISNSVDFPASHGARPKQSAPMAAISGGTTVSPLPVSTEISILGIGGNADGSVLYAVSPDAVYVSSDHGASWTQNAQLPVNASASFQGTINNISVDPIDPARVFIATSRGLYFSDSGGQFWGLHDYDLPNGASGTVNATRVLVSPVDRSTVYLATTQPVGLFKSTDAGFSWTALNPTYPGKPAISDFQSYALTLGSNGTDLYIVDPFGTMLKSTDGGTTWKTLSLPQQLYGTTAIQVDPADASTIYLTDYSGILKTSDSGATFTMLVPASFFPGSTAQIALDATSSVLYFGSSQSSVYMVPAVGGPTTALPVATSSLHSLVTLGGQVYAGFDTPSMPYVIKWDPTGTDVLYSTFFGGSRQDYVVSLAVDAQGNCTIAGGTASPDFPVTTKLSNASTGPTWFNGFVTRLNSDGTGVVYSSLLGGSGRTEIQGLALDSSGAAYVTGDTFAKDFPLTSNAFQTARPTTMCNRPQTNFLVPGDLGFNAFVSKIAPDGSQLAYSTLVTGSCGSAGLSLAVNANGEAVVAGYTTSTDLPTTAGSYQASFPGSPDQTAAPNAFQVGFAVRLSAGGDRETAGTYLGGSYSTRANDVAVDASGNTYLTGSTAKILPGATPGAYQATAVDRCAPPFSIGPSLPYTGTGDAFVLKLDPTLATARYLTYLGGSCDDSASGIALDNGGNAWISGITLSSDFPLKSPFQGTGTNNRFVSEISADGSQLLFSSSTDGASLAIDGTGAVHMAGNGNTPTIKKRAQSFGLSGSSVELSTIDPGVTPAVTIDNVQPVSGYTPAVLNPSNFGNGIAPGALIRITGRNLGPATRANAHVDSLGRLPFTLAGTTVRFDNVPAPVISVEDTAITCFAPFEISTTATVTVESNTQRSNPVRVGVPITNPQILNVLNQDGSTNSAEHPARPGEVLILYASGLGQTRPLSADGLTNSAPLPIPVAPLMVFLPGKSVQPEFAAAAPGQIAGIVQVNVRLPVMQNTTNLTSVSINGTNAPVYLAQ